MGIPYHTGSASRTHVLAHPPSNERVMDPLRSGKGAWSTRSYDYELAAARPEREENSSSCVTDVAGLFCHRCSRSVPRPLTTDH